MTKPDTNAIADLLAMRYHLPPEYTVATEILNEDPPQIRAWLDKPGEGKKPRERYTITVELEEAPDEQEGWNLTVDALDGLFGSLVESGLDHRDLPHGGGVSFRDATFNVEVELSKPDLDFEADRLLKQESED